MSDPIELSIENDDRLTDLPLLDALHYERDADGFSITFIPSRTDDATQSVFVPRDSVEGRQVSSYLYRIEDLIGNRIERVVHRGGGDYSLRMAGGEILNLSDAPADQKWNTEVFDRLKQIADTAEIAFNLLLAQKR